MIFFLNFTPESLWKQSNLWITIKTGHFNARHRLDQIRVLFNPSVLIYFFRIIVISCNDKNVSYTTRDAIALKTNN